MKLLLAYLFIVLGFSVISNVKTEAAVIQVCDKWGSTLPTNFFKSERKWKKHKNSSGKCKSYFKKDSKLIYNDLKNILKRYPYSDKTYTNIINKSDYSGFVNKHNVSWGNTGKDEILFAGNVMSIKAYCQLVDNHIGSLKNSIKYEKNCKKKPSQTQKMATVDLIFCAGYPELANSYSNIPDDDRCVIADWKKERILTTKGLCLKSDFNSFEYDFKSSCFEIEKKYGKKLYSLNYTGKKRSKHVYKFNIIDGDKVLTVDKFSKINKTQIAKAEPTIKPKKKVKVAKVEDSTQEEFKPKKTNQDNEAPVIEIAEAITVNDASYEIEGKVSDSSKNIFITVDGRTIPVKEGKFRIKRFSPVDEQIEIIATDQWGNRSQPKLVNITIDQQETIVADIFETLDPSKIKTRSNKNRVALIIGIEKYDQTPEASYANLDAKYFYEYVRKGFGVSKANIKLLVDEDANLIQSLGTLNKWLPGKIKDGKTELIIFFAGHGLASSDGKELYLLPQDSDPDLLARTALSRTELFQQIIALNPKSVTMFLDTCYSGISRDEKTLLASARPVRILANDQDTPNNFTIFSASKLDQISSGLKEAKHGIFSYYLMKGLEGKADANNDKDITNGELLAYIDQNVAQKASELGRQQNPSLAGDPDKILMSYQ
jgi:hypothetical protein